MPVLFKQVKVGYMFVLNGSRCIKRTKRTARLLEYGRTFYVGANEVCYL